MNNSYLLKVKDSTALLYNDKSPLENMHTSILFQIMENDELNILADFSLERQKHIRKIIIESTLSTDMSQHFSLYKNFKEIMGNYNLEDVSHRVVYSSMMVHASDLSNLLYEFDHYYRW